MHDNIGPSGGYMIDLNDASDDVWRNYFAGKFAAELLGLEVEEPAGYAKKAYDLADAMMAERKKREEGECSCGPGDGCHICGGK